MNIQKTTQVIITMGVVFLAGVNTSHSALLELTHDPLFLSQSTPPAIAVTYDDSGSMQRAYVEGMSNTGTSKTFADPLVNRLYYNPNITYRPPIGPDGVEMAAADFLNAKVDVFTDKITKGIDLSKNYIPIRNISYRRNGSVWIQFSTAGDSELSNIDTGREWWNQYPSDDEITGDVDGSDIDDDGESNDGVPAFYYEKNADGKYVKVVVPKSQYDNFANWYQYNNSRMKLGRTAISRAFSTFGGDFKIAWQQLNRNTTFAAMNRFEDKHRVDFFNNWLFKVPSQGGTPLRNAFIRTGKLFQNKETYSYKSGATSTTDYLSCQQNFHIAISDGAWKQDATTTGIILDEASITGFLPGDATLKPDPNPEDLLGQEYGPYSASANQAVFGSDDTLTTLSDISFHYWANDLMPDLKNNVKRYGQDPTDLNGNLIEPPVGEDLWDQAEYVWNPKNDPAYWQHVVTYNIGFGLNASLVEDYIKRYVDGDTNVTSACPEYPSITDPKEAVLRQIRKGECKWPLIPKANEKVEIVEKVDDVFHSSINSRGDFFSATNPDELIAALNDVINNILERISKGGSSAFTSAIITADTKAFSPGFDSSNWTGNFIAREILEISGFGKSLWDTACYLTGGFCQATGENVAQQTTRNLYTFDKSNDALIAFSGTLSGQPAGILSKQSEELRTELKVSVADIVNYVIGVDDNEISEGGRLRNRESVMGDIVHSSPVVIRGPGESYNDDLWPSDSSIILNDDSYLDFKIANQDRENLAFVGSNGGMLHAINVDGIDEGKERWGFIPQTALNNIHRLIDPTYRHWSFVDNTPVLGDAYFNNIWNSVLVGGMRYGGQAFYALDVTNSKTTQPKVLWEFTDEDDADMGYSYGQATIARISSTDDWVALIPNGYNNSQQDFSDATDTRNRIGDGSAVLYVVRLSDGKLLAKLDTNEGNPTTPNGLSTAVAVDSTQVGPIDQGADYAYAGDIYGNLWRFDLTSADYNDWGSSIKRVVEATTPLAQPISQKPRVRFLPGVNNDHEKDSVVIFATGKYIELPDRSKDIRDQFILGVFDGIDKEWTTPLTVPDTRFVEQTLTEAGQVRVVTDLPVDYNDSDVIGWKIELPTDGERISTPLELLGSQLLLVASTVPTGEDPCNSGGFGWVMAFDPFTGSTPSAGNIFETETTALDIDGNPITITASGIGRLVSDPPRGRITILEEQGGGAASIVLEGASETAFIDLDKFSWRRRNWSNLLTE